MSLQLYFNPALLPRTMSKKEWKECDRWRRVTQKQLAKAAEEEMKHLNELILFGRTEFEMKVKRDMIDNIVNPPILLGPYMDKSK